MTFRNRPPLTLLACLATTALLTSCTQSSPEAGRPNTAPPSASTGTSSSTRPSTTTSSTPTSEPKPSAAPTRPAEATGLTLAAAEKFIGYYVSLQNYAYATGESQYFMAESDKGCIGCKAISDFVKFSNASNGGLSGDYLDKLVSVSAIERRTDGKLSGSAKIQSGTYLERPSPSAKLVTRPAGPAVMSFLLSAQGNSWVMYELEIDG